MSHREFFDNLADGWDEGRDEEEVKKIGDLIQSIKIGRDELILDAGTGTGILFPLLKNNKIIAIDISFNMLKRAKEKFPGRSNLIQADIHDLPFDNEMFDRAILYAVFPHLSDKSKALLELNRILKPLGRLNILHSASRDEINRFHQEVGGAIKDDLIPDQTGMVDLFKNAGFKGIEILDLPDRYLCSGRKA